MSIRVCTAADASTLSLIGSATLLEAFAGLIPGHAILAHCRMNHTVAAWEGHLAEPANKAWIAEIAPGDFPIGYSLVTEPDFPEGLMREGDLELKRIYLFSRFHGNGVGPELMRVALEEARARGARRALLGVHPDNARALAFYARNGFKKVGTRPFHLGPETFQDPVLALEL
jgi:ribosomal protein S18 acetylase RimI-like enzyme